MSSFNTIFISLLGGVLPALVWLWFWLKEDRLHPEPRGRLMLAFLLGMAAVFVVLPVEKLIFSYSAGVSVLTILLWAGSEEIVKFLAAYWGALRSKAADEPIDAMIYMITVALGFSALENTLFISNLIDLGKFSEIIITGNSRFIGATLLHVATSASIGVMMGLAFYKSAKIKSIFLSTGILAAILLHTLFNFLIITLENDLFFVFSGVWVLIIFLIVLFEKIKKVKAQA